MTPKDAQAAGPKVILWVIAALLLEIAVALGWANA